MKKLHVVTFQRITTYRVTVETNSSAAHYEKQDAFNAAEAAVRRHDEDRKRPTDSVACLGTVDNAEIVASVPMDVPKDGS